MKIHPFIENYMKGMKGVLKRWNMRENKKCWFKEIIFSTISPERNLKNMRENMINLDLFKRKKGKKDGSL